MPRVVLFLAALVFILFTGVIHGLLSNRWVDTQALENALPRVPQVPMTIGDWHAENLPTDTQAYAQAGAKAYWSRLYKHARTGEAVNVILMCGRSGQMSVHTPDVCYRGAGFEMSGQSKRITVSLTEPGKTAEFLTGTFTKGDESSGQMRLYWAWNATGKWEAPDYSRWTFRGQPVLYKLYVIRQLPRQGEAADSDDILSFLRQVLPSMEKTLFPDPPA